jgi:hypothetical protein
VSIAVQNGAKQIDQPAWKWCAYRVLAVVEKGRGRRRKRKRRKRKV